MGAAESLLGEVDLQDLESLILWCRGAAALQPDATTLPLQRCEVSCLKLPVHACWLSLSDAMSCQWAHCQAGDVMCSCCTMREYLSGLVPKRSWSTSAAAVQCCGLRQLHGLPLPTVL